MDNKAHIIKENSSRVVCLNNANVTDYDLDGSDNITHTVTHLETYHRSHYKKIYNYDLNECQVRKYYI